MFIMFLYIVLYMSILGTGAAIMTLVISKLVTKLDGYRASSSRDAMDGMVTQVY